MGDYIVPAILLLAAVLALRRKENSYQILLDGAADGLRLIKSIVPALVLLLTAVTMLKASGAMQIIISAAVRHWQWVRILWRSTVWIPPSAEPLP